MYIILNFIYTHFFEVIIVILTGMITKYLVNQFGKDRAESIKQAVITAMLWAEEVYGIGHGDEKWAKAWQKILDILQSQGITLTEKEINTTTTLMKSNIPEINLITYSALPDIAKSIREVSLRSPETKKLIDDLKKKHKVKKS